MLTLPKTRARPEPWVSLLPAFILPASESCPKCEFSYCNSRNFIRACWLIPPQTYLSLNKNNNNNNNYYIFKRNKISSLGLSLPNNECQHPLLCQASPQHRPPSSPVSFCAHRGSPAQQCSSACARRVCKQAWNMSGTQESISHKLDVVFFLLAHFPPYFVLIWLSWYFLYSIKSQMQAGSLHLRNSSSPLRK